MRRKPVELIIWPIFLILIAAFIPVQIMLLYGHGIDEMSSAIAKMTLLNWLVFFALGACAYAILVASSQARFLMPATVIIVALNNFFVGYHGVDYSMWTATFATFCFTGFLAPLYKKEIRDLIRHPERRWWRVAPRKQVHVPVKIEGLHDIKILSETFDISTTGIFVPIENLAELSPNQSVQICLKFDSVAQFRCTGRVVRTAPANGRMPQGVGIEFVKLSAREKAGLLRKLAPLEGNS